MELQSNGNFFDNTNSAFPWGVLQHAAAETLKSGNKDHHHHQVQVHVHPLEGGSGDPEDIKWSEYLQSSFLLGASAAAAQNSNQTSQPAMYSDVKPDTHVLSNRLSTGSSTATWHHHQNQHQQALQASEIYTKDLQRLAVAFGETL